MAPPKTPTPPFAPGAARAGANPVMALLQQAVAAHQRGLLTQARTAYEEVLRRQPTNFDALHLLGVVALQSGDPQKSVELIERAISVGPRSPVAHSNLGNAWNAQGQPQRALKSYEAALALKPDYADAHFNRGVVLVDLQRWSEALEAFDRVLALQPGHAQALYNRGNAQQALGLLHDAVASYDRALALQPAFADAHCNRGNALAALGQSEEALASYGRAAACRPDFVHANCNRGQLLVRLGRAQDAVEAYGKAIALEPEHAPAFVGRGRAWQELGRVEAALADFRRAVALAPADASAWVCLGNAQRQDGKPRDALASFDQAMALDPELADAYNCRGNALADLGKTIEALADYAKAMALNPQLADAHWNAALCHLRLGDFERGWPEYEWRWKRERFTSVRRDFKAPVWLGAEDLQGRTILLHWEQGLGDTLQFCRYAPLVAALGARVVLEVQAPLACVVASLPGVSQVLAYGEPLPDFDVHCPLLSLPLALHTRVDDVPADVPYLRAPQACVPQWRERLGPRRALRVGLMWSGSTTHRNDRNRSLTLQQLWEQLLQPVLDIRPDALEVYSLQKEIRPGDAACLDAHPALIHFGQALKDFGDTAALVDQMDLVISVDTSVAHLSAALGRPTWVLLPWLPDWRWLLERQDSPWYASMRLFRQSRRGDWTAVLDRLEQALQGEGLAEKTTGGTDSSMSPGW
jgi:tetratricopeptide (TPR) repeat protein